MKAVCGTVPKAGWTRIVPEAILQLRRPDAARRSPRWNRSTLLAMAVAGILCLASASFAQEVVVHPTVAETTISRNVLRAIFGMRLRTWGDGTPIVVFVLDDRSKVHDSFSKMKLNIFPHQLRQAWDRLVYSGTGQAPISLQSELEMRARVAATPGGIGYLSNEWIDETVRVLDVQ
ncbi:MAG: hypothetical protein AB1578_03815 [Thermodesulfobacteriota bacterium]